MMRAQIAFEFVVMLSLAGLFFGVLSYFALDLFHESTRGYAHDVLLDVAYSVRDEFLLASEVLPGYHRRFVIPRVYAGFNISVSSSGSDGFIEFGYRGVSVSVFVPSFSGSVKPGVNYLWKDSEGGLHVS